MLRIGLRPQGSGCRMTDNFLDSQIPPRADFGFNNAQIRIVTDRPATANFLYKRKSNVIPITGRGGLRECDVEDLRFSRQSAHRLL
jgi:hypothetical protein